MTHEEFFKVEIDEEEELLSLTNLFGRAAFPFLLKQPEEEKLSVASESINPGQKITSTNFKTPKKKKRKKDRRGSGDFAIVNIVIEDVPDTTPVEQ